MALDNSFDDMDQRPKKRRRPMGLGALLGILALALFVALAGVTAFFYSQGLLTPYLRAVGLISDEPTLQELQQSEDVIYDFPVMIVTLLDDRGQRLQMLIEMRFILGAEEEIAIIEARRPALEDVFNYYLREIRLSDVRDRPLMDSFRRVVLDEVNATLANDGLRVRDLLFMDLAMQQQ